tara:strand:- start:433 stop:795 length:363 start_codon:yes stop_codon:yes gene_type:complete
MKTPFDLDKIYNKLPQEKTELSIEKVELGAIDDLRNDYKRIATKAVPLKRIIEKAANELEEVSNDLDKVQSNAKKLEGMAKELGADNIVKSAQDLFKSSGNLSSSWGKSAIKISSEAKNI